MTQNNHYVPQFIMRRYGDKINRYNVKDGRYIVKGSKLNAFVEKGLYPNELEIELSQLESNFANLLDKKILNASEQIILTREELWLIKKFFAVALLRVPASLFGPRNLDAKQQSEIQGFKEVVIPDESDLNYRFRTIEVILNAKNIPEVYNSNIVTYEACKWSQLFNNCYVTIWDSKECGEDFIITDNGMNCEHDKSRFKLFNGYYNDRDEMIKSGYINKCLLDLANNNNPGALRYFDIQNRMIYVHANYYLFAVSNNRTIALVNPFFRLYSDEIISETKVKPNVWPSKISEYALEANKCDYINKEQIEFDKQDKFIYKVKSLPLDDVILVNCLMLDRVDTWFGFDESAKILRSISTYNAISRIGQRNHFDKLITHLSNNGYELYKSKKYKDLAKYMVESSFTQAELECINFSLDLIKYENEHMDEIINLLSKNK